MPEGSRTPTATPPPEPRPEHSAPSESKKPLLGWTLAAIGFALVVGLIVFWRHIVGLLFIAAFLIAVAPMEIKGMLLGAETQVSPDKVIASWHCDASPYTWRVIEKDATGGGFEFGGYEKWSYRVADLQADAHTILEAPGPSYNLTSSQEFPFAAHFLTAMPSNSVITDALYRTIFNYISISSAVVDEKEFRDVSQCFFAHASSINAFLSQQEVPSAGIYLLMLLDDSLQKDVSDEVVYACDGGTEAAVSGNFIYLRKPHTNEPARGKNPYESEWIITLNGRVQNYMSAQEVINKNGDYEVMTHYIARTGAGDDPAKVLPHCVNKMGTTLVDFVTSLPSRIEYYE